MTDLQAPPTVIESDGVVAWSTLVALARWGHDPCITVTVPLGGGRAAVDEALRRAVADATAAVQAHDGVSRALRDLVLRPLHDLAHRGLPARPPDAAGAVFTSAPGLWAELSVPVTVEAAAHVGGVPHVLPLLPARRTGERYAVLCVSESCVRVFEGDAAALRAVHVPQLPGAIDGIVWEHDGTPAAAACPARAAGRPAADRPDAADPDEHADRLRRFLRRVDYAVVAHLGTTEPLPLVLVGDPALTERYAAASHYPWVVALADGAGDACSVERLHARTWPVAAHHLRAPLQAELDDLRRLAGTGLILEHPDDVARSARNGEVAALVVAGRWCRPGGAPDRAAVAAVDEAVVHTWRHRGTVFLAADGELGATGLAARLRS